MMQVYVREARMAGLSVAGSIFLAAAASTAHAQWTVTNLHPAEGVESRAHGVSGGQQVGAVSISLFVPHASLWSGSAKSWVDLHPASAFESQAVGTSDGQQVGWVRADDNSDVHASLWSGSAASWVDLNPAESVRSLACCISGGQQVGSALFFVEFVKGGATFINRASLWSGSATSWVDLHPVGASYSVATGISGGQQVGYAGEFPNAHASLWNGSAESWVDLNPAGSTYSEATGVSGGQQVGFALVGGPGNSIHASLWSGSAASWVDLHPAGAASSEAIGVSGGQQVGYVGGSGFQNTHASLWSGTPASWVDLHTFLPAEFLDSQARSIWSDANFTYVAGFGSNTLTGRVEALLWTLPTPCAADFNADGAANSGDFFDFLTAFFNNDPAADFNHDSQVNSQDFFNFLVAFFAGC